MLTTLPDSSLRSIEYRVPVESFRPHWERILRVGHSRFRHTVRTAPEGTSGRNGRPHNWQHRDRFGVSTAVQGRFDKLGFCIWLGITKIDYETIERAMKHRGVTGTVSLFTADKVLTGAGEPHTVQTLYVIERDWKDGPRYGKPRKG